MVSSIWNAASEGRIDDLNVLLADATPADIEIKDQNGVTPLIQAVQNGHTQVVKALIDKGADPASVLSQGPVQQFTQNPQIIELFNVAQSKMASGNVSSESGYPTNVDVYPPPPPGAYPYYPTLNGPPPVPEGAVFYPPQPSADGQHGPNFGPGNLPPPDIARLIPCRYFPACRYGSSCMFAHPQTPYFQGPMPPPAQYSAPYDPMNQNYNPNYYNMPPPPFQSPSNGPVPMSSIPSPPVGPPPMSAGPSPNEMPPPPPVPFSPNGVPPPVPYPAMSPMMSPSAYPQPGPPGSVPMPSHPLPPLYHQPPPQPPSQSPYNTNTPSAPYGVQPNGLYPSGPVPVPVSYPDVKSPPLNPQPDNYGPPVNPVRDPVGHNRRGSIRRGSLGTRKPPCMFFPAGKCKNGDDCRFPHILSDNSGPHHQPFSGGRGGAPRTRPHVNNVNGIGTIEEKMSAMSVRDSRSEQGPRVDAGPRPRYPPGYKNGTTNGQTNKRPPVVKAQQRVPNADDFPVLPGTTTPPAKAGLNGYFGNGNGNGASGPTAAQVLQAPAPRKESSVNGAQTRTGSPDSTTDQKQDVINGNGYGNGIVEHPRIPQPTSVPQKQIPITFASIAAGTPPEPAAEVSVTA